MATTSWTLSQAPDDLGDQYAIRVRIPNPPDFNAISESTRGGTLCTIHRYESADPIKDPSSTPGPESGPSGGVLLFKDPKSLHEKLRKRLPDGFVAGRQEQLNDLDLGPDFPRVSRHHFAIGLYKSKWVVFNLSRNGTWVNDYFLCGEKNLLALNPDEENEIRLGSPPLSLFIRCHAACVKDLWPNYDTTFSETDNASQVTSVATVQYHPGAGPDLPLIYYLKDRELPSRTQVRKILALNAMTCEVHVAKAYPILEKHRLQKRIALLQALPHASHSPFLQDHVLVIKGDDMYSLAPYIGSL